MTPDVTTFVSAMPKKITGAKIACLDFSLQKAKMKLGVQVLVEDPEKLEAIRARLDHLAKISSIRIHLYLHQRIETVLF